MVLPKSSRKGKKAWRRNIDTSQELDVLAQQTEEAQQGTAVSTLDDAQLFFVDKAGHGVPSAALATHNGSASIKRPRPRTLPPKVLTKAQAILQAAHRAIPVCKPIVKKPKGSTSAPQQGIVHKKGAAGVTNPSSGDGSDSEVGEECQVVVVPEGDVWTAGQDAAADQWLAAPADSLPAASLRKRRKTGLAGAPVPAVEVDLAGCSFNPPEEAHQDALAKAVAAEMAKEHDAERLTKAPPKTVDYQVETDELAQLQVDDDDDTPDDGGGLEGNAQITMAQQQVQRDGHGTALSTGDRDAITAPGAVMGAGNRSRDLHRKTQKDLNRAKRRRAQEEEEARRKAIRKQRRELDQLRDIQQQLDAELQSQALIRARRQADRQERLQGAPPRLGPVPFIPEPLQVLLTEEVSGSLRQIKATPTVLRDRYKSFQKRGILEPRRPQSIKQGKRLEYVHGARGDGAVERHEEISKTRHRLKKAVKAQKAQ